MNLTIGEVITMALAIAALGAVGYANRHLFGSASILSELVLV